MNAEQLTDKALWDSLEKAGLADKLESSPEWKLLKEAADRIVERAIHEFAMKTDVSADPKDLAHIIRIQQVLRMYKYGLFKEVDVLKRESEYLFYEAKERGMLGGAFDEIKEKFKQWTA